MDRHLPAAMRLPTTTTTTKHTSLSVRRLAAAHVALDHSVDLFLFLFYLFPATFSVMWHVSSTPVLVFIFSCAFGLYLLFQVLRLPLPTLAEHVFVLRVRYAGRLATLWSSVRLFGFSIVLLSDLVSLNLGPSACPPDDLHHQLRVAVGQF